MLSSSTNTKMDALASVIPFNRAGVNPNSGSDKILKDENMAGKTTFSLTAKSLQLSITISSQ